MESAIIDGLAGFDFSELNALSAFRARKKLLSEDERYENMFNALLKRKTDILSKIQVKDDGSPGAIVF